MIRKVSFYLALAVLGTVSTAIAQQQAPPTKFAKIMARTDIGISAAGILNNTVSGRVTPAVAANAGTIVSDQASNTVGELVNIRYIQKPYVGFEFNFVNARYTQNYSYPGPAFGVQSGAREYTIGYIVTPRQTILGFQPFVSVGGGTTEFKPTPHGGEGLLPQARATYYYSVGLQGDINPHFGLRVGFRQAFFLAPDFGQNYLTILQHTSSYQPTAGFYLRF